MYIGTRIRDERLAKGWSQGMLAQRAGVSKTLVSEIENDPRRTTTKIVQLAHALRVNPIWLETGKGPKAPPAGEAPYISADSLEDLADQLVARGGGEVGRLMELIVERCKK